MKANTISQKLRIRENAVLLVLNPPADFAGKLKGLPPGVSMKRSAQVADQVHWFVRSRAQLEKQMSSVMKRLREGMIVWVYYPKGSSGIQTDLTRDKGWDCLMAEKDRFTWISLVSFDETWSAFGFRPKTERERRKAATAPTEKEILKWADPVTRKLKLPPDLARALKTNKTASDFFHSLSFTNRKEYIEWIVTAKKEETRKLRLEGTMERLEKKWKNPRNI